MTRHPTFSGVIFAASLILCAPGMSFAQIEEELDQSVEQLDEVSTAVRGERVVERIAEDFRTITGDNSEALVRSLRSGQNFTYQVFDDRGNVVDTVIAENPSQPLGYGGVFISLTLANGRLGDVEEPTTADMANALFGYDAVDPGSPDAEPVHVDGVLEMRQAGMGWGQIAHEFGFKLGHLVSDIRSAKDAIGHAATRPDKPAQAQQVSTAGKPDKAERAEKPEKPDRPDRPEKPERPGR